MRVSVANIGCNGEADPSALIGTNFASLTAKQIRRKMKTKGGEKVNLDISKASEQDWFVMTALRGPDNDNTLLKTITTAVIRCAAGVPPYNTSDRWHTYGFMTCSIETAKADWAAADKMEQDTARAAWKDSTHFQHHIELAMTALGLSDYFYWLRNVLS